jgi:hypothetical protein
MQKKINIIKEIIKLPKVKIKFSNHNKTNVSKYFEIYRYFTKLHRLKLFRNKTIGIALIDLNQFNTYKDYYDSINGKNSAAYYSRKATKREYIFGVISRNEFIDDIYEINTSASLRQGRKMSEHYLKKQEHFIDEEPYIYFGVKNKDGKLLAYCYIGFFGEFILINTLLGHKKYLNDGIMYLMMVELNKIVFEQYKKNEYKYIMYDTFFGATDGLKLFKEKLGYKPYKVKWIWED